MIEADILEVPAVDGAGAHGVLRAGAAFDRFGNHAQNDALGRRLGEELPKTNLPRVACLKIIVDHASAHEGHAGVATVTGAQEQVVDVLEGTLAECDMDLPGFEFGGSDRAVP